MRPCKVGCVAQRPKELCKPHRALASTRAEQGISCSAKRKSPKGMVSETSSGKNAKRKVAPTRQISRRDRS
ncbi:hypothetical protein BHE74_00009018 [Ensete ventricosum]|nr:hypothetical protein GW17_00030813 [Ensete ventricosum]RWW82516.1 hypothetical protein BHE74_00009018 [Ensete ventricosum]